MDSLTFLLDGERGNATLVVQLPGSISRICNVCPYRLLERCPLLYHAFEQASHASLASIETSTLAAAVSFLRFLYTGDYYPAAGYASRLQCPLLIHAELYKIAEDFDVPELQVATYVSFMRETELACSLPAPPLALAETILFTYKHLASRRSRQEHSIVDTLLNYCISTFRYHRLGEDPQFRAIATQTPLFLQDLCQTNMKRGFEDEAATDVISFCNSVPTVTALTNKLLVHDIHHDLFSDLEESVVNADNEEEHNRDQLWDMTTDDTYELARRPKNVQNLPMELDSAASSDVEEGFTIVHRPRFNLHVSTDTKTSPTNDTNDTSSSPLEMITVALSDDDLMMETSPAMPAGNNWTLIHDLTDDWDLI
ncbi:hypothetical protein BDV95DRAFT_38573 [Massariosphaeria phaeospora]|uniref:BTB domain-containing protein n=1 Tax=Massariosphaeria phaeospora TaxID=100035 RepID=A0A7C8M6Q8_9PLEO|nr:hypothetical protein BDV95DRAFT_38573 [Massariosphaeria phaeospora]